MRVSTGEQELSLQIDASSAAGCEHILQDQASGALVDRQRLTEAVSYARDGDTVIVWKLDRLGRLMKHLLETVAELQDKGASFCSLTENIDTTTPGAASSSTCSAHSRNSSTT
jgi:DNA invertase Pin-like site-specific DNA recombinase